MFFYQRTDRSSIPGPDKPAEARMAANMVDLRDDARAYSPIER